MEDGARSGIQETHRQSTSGGAGASSPLTQPTRLALISKRLEQFLPALTFGELPCAILLDRGKPLALHEDFPSEAAGWLRDAFAAQSAHATGL